MLCILVGGADVAAAVTAVGGVSFKPMHPLSGVHCRCSSVEVYNCETGALAFLKLHKPQVASHLPDASTELQHEHWGTRWIVDWWSLVFLLG